MSLLTSPLFWQAAAERSVSTAAQTGIAVIGLDAVTVADVSWAYVGGAALLAALLSLLKSVAVANIGNVGPGLGPEQLVPPAAKHAEGDPVELEGA